MRSRFWCWAHNLLLLGVVINVSDSFTDGESWEQLYESILYIFVRPSTIQCSSLNTLVNLPKYWVYEI